MSKQTAPAQTILPPDLHVTGMTKTFGPLVALDDISLNVPPGTFHALLGENGAGKSTLVKCMMGYYKGDTGTVRYDGTEVTQPDPKSAHKLGLGMVYQHFTLVPSMTVAENLVLGEAEQKFVVDWARASNRLTALLDKMPFDLDLDRSVLSLAAGEKQKLEILKQLHLGTRILILDEPTSVLTPNEADEVLGLMRSMVDTKEISVILITHKLHEVEAFADEVSVLRHGKLAGQGLVKDLTRPDMIRMMIGQESVSQPAARDALDHHGIYLEIRDLGVENEKGVPAVQGTTLTVAPGEILGIAGISGNGQKELVEALAGQRDPFQGEIIVKGELFHHTRKEMHDLKMYLLPEEPLQNGCVKGMSVAENLALRSYDRPPFTKGKWFLDRGANRAVADNLIGQFKIKTQGADARIETLSGGNVQRTVLARELSGDVDVLVAQNPCFGLDLNATAEIRNRIMAARNAGAAVLLISEDLDEVMELSDRVMVMFEGRIVYETPIADADIHVIGSYMASHD